MEILTVLSSLKVLLVKCSNLSVLLALSCSYLNFRLLKYLLEIVTIFLGNILHFKPYNQNNATLVSLYCFLIQHLQ